MDCTYSHDDLSQCIHYGQVNNSSVQEEEEKEEGLNRCSSCSDTDKIDKGQKSKDEISQL